MHTADLAEYLDNLIDRYRDGFELEYRVSEEQGLEIEFISACHIMEGSGTDLMALVLAAADRFRVPVSLTVEPTRLWDNQNEYDLYCWFTKFDFEPGDLDEFGYLIMSRPTGITGGNPEAIVKRYRYARVERMGRKHFERTMQLARAIE